jgi:DNA-binding PadR family transcriptional regulator
VPTKVTLNATAASLLGFLHEGPLTGWDLLEHVDGSVGNFWNVTRSQVYRELKTLAAQGLVATGASGQRDRVPYAITKAGRAAFAEWISREPGEGVLRLPLVLTVFFGAHVDPARLARFLQSAHLEHQRTLEGYRAIRPEVTEPYQRAALELGIAYEQTMLDWIAGLPWTRERGGAAAARARATRAARPKKYPKYE